MKHIKKYNYYIHIIYANKNKYANLNKINKCYQFLFCILMQVTIESAKKYR